MTAPLDLLEIEAIHSLRTPNPYDLRDVEFIGPLCAEVRMLRGLLREARAYLLDIEIGNGDKIGENGAMRLRNLIDAALPKEGA